MQAEALLSRAEYEYRRIRDMHEMLPTEDLHQRIADRYAIAGQDLFDLATGQKNIAAEMQVQTERNLFSDSTSAVLDASKDDLAAAERYLYFECHTAAFESISCRGHAESLTYKVDQIAGDAFVTPGRQFGQIYLKDMARDDQPEWRARLSFVEWYNNESIAELTRRGELAHYVVAEFSLFPYHAEESQAVAMGYDPETYKSFIRTSQVDDDATERTIQTLSYTDMLPADVQLLRAYFGLPVSETANAESILAQPLLIPKEWYEAHGGIGGIAQLVDQIKQQRDGKYYRFGEAVEEPVDTHVYADVVEISELRKSKAEPVIRALMEDMLRLARQNREGSITTEDQKSAVSNLLKNYRVTLLQNDPSIAIEHFGESMAASLETLTRLEAAGLTDDAALLMSQLQREIGTSYVCGMAIRMDEEGKAVDANGNATNLECKEIKNGDLVKCPSCGFKVKVKVEANGLPYCTNPDLKISCPLRKAGSKGAIPVINPPKAVPPAQPVTTQRTAEPEVVPEAAFRKVREPEVSGEGAAGMPTPESDTSDQKLQFAAKQQAIGNLAVNG